MVVNDLHLQSITLFPDKADAPLIVDSNAVLSGSIPPQFLKPVRWWNPQCIQAAGRREKFELPSSQELNVPGQPSRKSTTKDSTGLPTLERFDHRNKY